MNYSKTIFLKETSQLPRQLQELKNLIGTLTSEGEKELSLHIKKLEYGSKGEENIIFELKNSNFPMYVLRDIILSCPGFHDVQIDFMIFTRKICFILECKNMYGNIEIKADGSFIRSSSYKGKWSKEGIYSPITQSERHMQIAKQIKVNLPQRFFPFRNKAKITDDRYANIIVFANPKSILNNQHAPAEIKNKVIRSDQLIAYIKNAYTHCPYSELSDEETRLWATTFLDAGMNITKSYSASYEQFKKTVSRTTAEGLRSTNTSLLSDSSESRLRQELKDYRLTKSREEQIKAYYIFNDKCLEIIISEHPDTINDLLQLPGFGPVKAEKYGEDILHIIRKYV